MAQRKARKDDFMPSTYLLNKGLPSTRQQEKEQTTSRPVSDFNAKKRHNSLNDPEQRHKRNYDNFMSNLYNSQELRRNKQQQKVYQSVKFNENIDERVKAKTKPEVSNPSYNSRKRYEYPNRSRVSSGAESDTEVDDGAESLYDNENFKSEQSESDCDEDIDESIQGLQKGLNQITSKYVKKVKSQVEGAMSKLKLNETRKAQLPKQEVKQLGAGDIKAPQTDELYKKMELMKKECYKKIEANLNMLKNIDNLTDEIHNNLFNQRKSFY